jgi:hypothetical protein
MLAKRLRNESKLHLLVTLDAARHSLTLAELSVASGQPVATLRVECWRLLNQGLLRVYRQASGGVAYGMTWKGRERLAWLREERLKTETPVSR